ncbi:MAG TPA: hypothetical protein VL793_16630 [Patescibacteria group bacterium]|nr:hypothetical protein [Patescibacteria group bacterium]
MRLFRKVAGLVSTEAVLVFPLVSWLGQAAAQPVAVIGRNFTAATLRVDSSAVPPDSEGAVGLSHYVEFINGRFSVFNKSDGAQVKTMTDRVFWSQAGITLPSTWDVTDPRLIFDTSSQRWFASQVDFDTTGAINTNRFLLAISSSPDPTGSWNAVFIPSDPGGNLFADFPTLGMDAEAVYLSGDMFDASFNPVGPTLVSVPKSSLLTATPSTTGMHWFGVLRYDVRGEILQPVTCLDGSGKGTILATSSVGFDTNGNPVTNSSLVISRVKNPTGPQPALSASSLITVGPYTVPPFPAQPDGSLNLDNGDARFSAFVYEVGGVLYATHSSQLGNLSVIRWYRIDEASQAVLESGTISDPVNDLYYPSIAANATGTVVIAYNASGPSTFPGSFAVVGITSNGVTTFGQPMLLKAGTASYQNLDSNSDNRWGDYSAVNVDPIDPSRFWTIQEIATGSSVWSTQVTELLTGAPTLSFASAGNQLLLSWPGTPFILQTASDLANPSWTPITVNLSTNNDVVTAQLPMNSLQAFFRLQAP